MIGVDLGEQWLDGFEHHVGLGQAHFLNNLYLLPGSLTSTLGDLTLSDGNENLDSLCM